MTTGTATRLTDRLRHLLDESRARTLALTSCVDDDALVEQVSPLMSPLVWDLAHIGNYEELWLVRALSDRSPTDPLLDDLYNAFEHPRGERPSLPLLGPADAREYAAGVRAEAMNLLEVVDVSDSAPRLTRHGFVHAMVAQHEQQHCETMVATHQLRGDRAVPPPGATPAPSQSADLTWGDQLAVPGGRYPIGTSADPWAYDNERGRHDATLADFSIDVVPVTNAAFAGFVAAGGYDEQRWWSDGGWAWRHEAALTHPEFWRREGEGSWSVLRFGRRIDLVPGEPVQHVCWHEAEAFCRWAGRRLPTEQEWEVAATCTPDGSKLRHPWGDGDATPAHANLGQRHDGPAVVGSYPAGVSPWGCHQMEGDVWEWTASRFGPWPGFEAFPYAEYSEVFFGNAYPVLRGGSWAAHPIAVRGTFRNWDHPIRRQIFAGFRTATSA